MNAFTWVGVVVMVLFALSLTRDVYSNTWGLRNKMVSSAAPTWWELFSNAPLATLTGHYSDLRSSGNDTPRPTLDVYAVSSINPVPSGTIAADKLTSFNDLISYVEDVTHALDATGKLKDPCEPLTDLRKPWVNASGNADTPLCLVSKSGDTVWLASIVNSSTSNMFPMATGWLGAFHRGDDKRWRYYNVEGLVRAPLVKLAGYPSISFDMIPYQVANDFPYVIAKPKETL